MADRVFPNNLSVNMGSKITFSGIDWDVVENNIQNQKFANNQSNEIQALLKLATVNPEIEEIFNEAFNNHPDIKNLDPETKEKLRVELKEKIDPNMTVDTLYNEISKLPDMKDQDKNQNENVSVSNSNGKMEKLSIMKSYLNPDSELYNFEFYPNNSWVKELIIKLADGKVYLKAAVKEGLKDYVYTIDRSNSELYQEFLENLYELKKSDGESGVGRFITKARKDNVLKDFVEDEPEMTDESETNEKDNETLEDPANRNEFALTNNNTMKKIAFTHPNQISAEAIEAAKAAGDTKLVNTILAARKANRQRIASAIEKQSEISSRVARREKILRMAEENLFTDEEMLDDNLDPMDPKNKKKVPGDLSLDATLAFKSPEKFSTAQRNAFKKIAKSLGMPEEYINAMCKPVISPEVQKLSEEIKQVYSSNVSNNVKNSLIKTMIKEAKLSTESKNEFIRYWNETLDYQDKQFYKDVAADYVNGKKVN